MAYIPKKVAERFSKELGKFQKVIENARNRDLNEADTVDIINDILSSLFGYDKYTETTREFAIRGTYCDIAIVVDGNTKFLIEVKAVCLNLTENHLRQAMQYGSTHGVRWIVLTNGIDWQIHEIVLKDRVSVELVCRFNFLELKAKNNDDQQRLFLLCKEALDKAAIKDFHQYQQSVNRFSIGAILLGRPVIDTIRREIRKMSPGVKVENSEIEDIIQNEVLKREIVDGKKTKEAKSHYKRYLNKLKKQKAKTTPTKPQTHVHSQELLNQSVTLTGETDSHFSQ